MPLGASRHRDTSRTVNAAEGKLRDLLGRQIDAIIAQGKFRSQSEIARDLNVAPNWLSMMKVGRGPVSLDILPGMAKTLDLDLGQLIRLWFEDYYRGAGIVDVIREIIVTEDELPMLREYRASKKPSRGSKKAAGKAAVAVSTTDPLDDEKAAEAAGN
ncbi:helix-turn-helix domain-containing protein [Inquilinus sp. OTU3971]|uniref:helix-turn-helix domain-containing protein n=1 Tax=Inquilinus sp. OTU3971 TaxID=3043855 RepID=UPI00313B9616